MTPQPMPDTKEMQECRADFEMWASKRGHSLDTRYHIFQDITASDMWTGWKAGAAWRAAHPTPAPDVDKLYRCIASLADAHTRICKGSGYEIGWESDGKDYGVSDAALKANAATIAEAQQYVDAQKGGV